MLKQKISSFLIMGIFYGLILLAGSVTASRVELVKIGELEISNISTNPVGIDGNEELILMTAQEGLIIVNIIDPNTPDRAGVKVDRGAGARDIKVKDSFAYVADGYGMAIYSFNNLGVISTLDEGVILNDTFTIPAQAVFIKNNYCYLLGTKNENSVKNVQLGIYDISNPLDITSLGNFTEIISGEATDIFVNINYVYALTSDMLLIIDENPLDNPTIKGSLGMVDAKSIVIESRFYLFAYIVDSSGLLVVDIAQASSPSIVNSLKMDSPTNLFLSKDLFVADMEGVHVYDITSDPENPKLKSSFTTSTPALGVYVDANERVFVQTDKYFYILEWQVISDNGLNPLFIILPIVFALVVMSGLVFRKYGKKGPKVEKPAAEPKISRKERKAAERKTKEEAERLAHEEKLIEDKKIQDELERKAQAELDRNIQKRIDTFRKVIERTAKLKLKQLAEMLEMEEKNLLIWLYDLPKDFGFVINEDVVEFDVVDIDASIDHLLESFESMEKTQQGKSD